MEITDLRENKNSVQHLGIRDSRELKLHTWPEGVTGGDVDPSTSRHANAYTVGDSGIMKNIYHFKL